MLTFSTLLSAASVFTAVAAQTTHIIAVGSGGLRFAPISTTAAVGDTIVFNFVNGTVPHNVGRSEYASPCAPSTSGTAFYSTTVYAGNFSLLINDTQPIWFYCSTGRHCMEGMVGAINAQTGSSMSPQAFRLEANQASSVTPYSASSPIGGRLSGAVTTPVAVASASASAASSATRGIASSTAAAAGGASASAVRGTTTSSTGAAASSGSATTSRALSTFGNFGLGWTIGVTIAAIGLPIAILL